MVHYLIMGQQLEYIPTGEGVHVNKLKIPESSGLFYVEQAEEHY